MANNTQGVIQAQRQGGRGGGGAARTADPHAAREAARTPARTSAAKPRIAAPARSTWTACRSSPARCLTVQCDGAEMLTVEGLEQGGVLHALQQAFHEEHGLQCGYCTPGMITRAYRLLKENPNPSEQEIRYGIAGNLCRCTGYQNIVKAVQSAAKKLAAAAGRGGLSSNASQHRIHRRNPWATCPNSRNAKKNCRAWAPPCCARRTRKFIRGQGSYIDDIKLPGMLFGAIVRSPYAHARIKCIDKTQGAGLPRRGGGADRRRPEAGQPALDAHAGRRRAGGAGRQEGLLPDAGSGDGAGHRPLRRRRRRRAGRGGLRRAAGHRRPEEVDGQGRADHPRGHRRQEGSRPRPAHASEPHLHLGGRRQGRGRRGLRQRRGHGARGDPQPARASLPAGDLRLRRLVQQGHRLPDGVHDDAGAAPGAHRAGDAVGHRREQDPRGRRRHRRRLRQQGAGLPGLRGGHRRVDRHRRAGEVDRVAHRQHLHHRLCARLPRRRRTGGRQGRPHQGPALHRAGRPRRVQLACLGDQAAGGPVFHLHRLATPSRTPIAASTRSTPTRRRAAWPTAARCA